jgi:hypothetical protein
MLADAGVPWRRLRLCPSGLVAFRGARNPPVSAQADSVESLRRSMLVADLIR